ncbi:MAG: hypothetical protein J5886_02775 [Bacteroidales bacterium]|nr:hypothetical protein [Bacteroidales bacterium]
MVNTSVIITLFSADKVRLDEDSVARIHEGDYPIRVKSKILASVRDSVSASESENVVGFLPTSGEDTLDHYSELALYLTPEISCKVVSDLISIDAKGRLSCKAELVKGNSVIVISDDCSDWSKLEGCLSKAGAEFVKCISILG